MSVQLHQQEGPRLEPRPSNYMMNTFADPQTDIGTIFIGSISSNTALDSPSQNFRHLVRIFRNVYVVFTGAEIRPVRTIFWNQVFKRSQKNETLFLVMKFLLQLPPNVSRDINQNRQTDLTSQSCQTGLGQVV